MNCSGCVALAGKRDKFRSVYAETLALFNAACTSTDTVHYMELRKSADEALIDFELADTEFQLHQDRHAVPQ
jgi:hypothetical protein